MPPFFRIRGGDGQEYGPATAEQVLEWIQTGRADHFTPIRDEDSGLWHRLDTRPEFASTLPAAHPEGRRLPGGSPPDAHPSTEELRTRPVRPHVLDSFAAGSKLMFRQPKAIAGAFARVAMVVLAFFALSFIPSAVVVTLPAGLVVTGLLASRLSWLALRAWRGEAVRPSEVFLGLRSAFLPLVLTSITLLLLTILASVPGLALIAQGVETGTKAQDLNPETAALLLAGAALTPVLTLVPFAFWGFAPTLILDRQIGLWEAFRLSRRITTLHPFRSLLFAAACAILLLTGLLLGGVGLLFTAPWVLGARARMHDELFGPRHAPPG